MKNMLIIYTKPFSELSRKSWFTYQILLDQQPLMSTSKTAAIQNISKRKRTLKIRRLNRTKTKLCESFITLRIITFFRGYLQNLAIITCYALYCSVYYIPRTKDFLGFFWPVFFFWFSSLLQWKRGRKSQRKKHAT